MVVRARRSIPAGGEIFIAYQSPKASYPERTKNLSKHFPSYGDGCQCELCLADRRDQNQLPRRLRLLEELVAMGKLMERPLPANTRQIESWFSSLQATYTSPRPLLRADRIISCILLSLYHRCAQNYEKSSHYLVLSLEYRGIALVPSPRKGVEGGKFSPANIVVVEGPVDDDDAIETILQLVSDYRRVFMTEEANAWARAAFDLGNIRHGGGKAMFFARYQKLLEQQPLNLLEFMRNHR